LSGFFEHWLGLLAQVRFQDLIDLVLVWLVVYQILLLIKRSGAVQILAGLGVLAVAYMASIWLELVTFNLLLEKFFSNLFLIVVILFQGEIRRALAQIGSNSFFSNTSRIEEAQLVDELSKALVACAQRGFGALVVIENEISLDYFLEEGVPIRAEVSSDLIQSIFHPQSPLHDGAILIQNGRIESASCFLPLSKNSALDKNLGTRHRAAIGLTEETDASVFVVSEEQKAVSYAHGGILSSHMDHADVRQALFELFGVKKAQAEKAAQQRGEGAMS
jgi:diadenylate cyclase